jgi:hypothetical protein
MASLSPKETQVKNDLVEKNIKSKEKEEKKQEEEESGQMAAVEHIVNHDFIRESREFWKKEMAKEMSGQRDNNTKIIEKK